MLLTKRYRNIITLMVIQAFLFVLYGVHVHFYYDGRTTTSNLQQLSDGQLDNMTIRVSATDIDNRTHYVTTESAEVFVRSGMIDIGSVRSVSSSWLLIADTNLTHGLHLTGPLLSSADNNTTEFHSSKTSNNVSNSESYRIKVNASNLYPAGKVLSFSAPNEISQNCIESFLKRYSEYCHSAIVPLVLDQAENASALCPCIPQTLIGTHEVSFNENPFSQTEAEHPEVLLGGQWAPAWCVARQRIAVIVPFRDRESHLKAFIRVLHPFLQRQLLDYTIFVVEQDRPSIFNKASLMNAGFEEVRSRYEIDCFIFHDVDMLPEDDRNFYGCYKSPRHVGAYVDKHKYNLLYNGIFGGATAFTEKQFTTLNGYSNEFYGWGGEDDDMFNRIKWTHLNFLRFPKCVARYRMIKHKRDKANPYSESQANRAWSMRPQVYKKNGLNSLSYKLVKVEKKPLFTRILIALDEPQVHKISIR